MRAIFADTLYWVGLLDQKDPWHEPVMRANRAIVKARVVTTDAVIVEAMNSLSGSGPRLRDHVPVSWSAC